MITIREILTILLTICAAPFGVKLLDYAIAGLQSWWRARQDKNHQFSQLQIEQKKIEQIGFVDVSKIKRDEFQILIDQAVNVATQASRRSETAEIRADEERSLRLKIQDSIGEKFDQLEAEIEDLKREEKFCLHLREQMEREIRGICDTLRIAYWTITIDGRLEGNITFFDLTGLKSDDCHNDGWFSAVEESERELKKLLWQKCAAAHETRPRFRLKFQHLITKKIVETEVFFGARTIDGIKVWKFTARTNPLADTEKEFKI